MSDMEILRTSILMALQDLDAPDMEKEERRALVEVAKAKAALASSYAKLQKNVLEAEKLRQEYGEVGGAAMFLPEGERK